MLPTTLFAIAALALPAEPPDRPPPADDGARAFTTADGSLVVVDSGPDVSWSAERPRDGLSLQESEGAVALAFPDGTVLRTDAHLALDARHHASAALRAVLRVDLDGRADERPAVVVATDAPVPESGRTSGAYERTWARPVESSTELWWPCAEDDEYEGAHVAIGPVFSGDLEALAVWLVGRELIAERRPQLAERLDAATPRAGGWIAAPGELWCADTAALTALVDEVDRAIFASAHLEAACARIAPPGKFVVARALDGHRLGECLWQFGARPDQLAAAVQALTPERFHELHRQVWNADAFRVVDVRAAAPEGGFAFDLSKSAWLQGSDAGRRMATALVKRLGGAEIWTSVDALRLETTTRTSTQLGDTIADSIITRMVEGTLTHVSQQVEIAGRVQSIATTYIGPTVLIRMGENLIAREGATGARLAIGERRALLRLVTRLAARESIGARVDSGALELFDAHAVLGRLTLDEDGGVAELTYTDAAATRRFVYGEAVEFDGRRFPGSYREVGERDVEVTVTGLIGLASIDTSLFADPRR